MIDIEHLSDEELQKLAGKYRFTCSRAGTATISPRNCDHLTKDNHTLVPYVGSRFCRANYASELTKKFLSIRSAGKNFQCLNCVHNREPALLFAFSRFYLDTQFFTFIALGHD
jgi:hypothetical protein